MQLRGLLQPKAKIITDYEPMRPFTKEVYPKLPLNSSSGLVKLQRDFLCKMDTW